MRVFLFGSNEIRAIPSVVENHIGDILKQTNGDVEFILGDTTAADVAYQLVLSRLGARAKTTLYCIETVRNNKFEFNTNVIPKDEVDNGETTKYKNRRLCDDCDFAIGLWDGKTKSTFDTITMLNMRNKHVYTYTVQV